MPAEREKELLRAEEHDTVFYRGRGCAHCMNTGYQGRVGIYEIMNVSDTLRELVAAKRPATEIRARAIADGMSSLRKQGLIKARAGLTTLEEVLRETASL